MSITHYRDHTLKEFYLMALRELNTNVRKETAEGKIRRIERHVIPYFGDMKLRNITPLRVEQRTSWGIKI